MYLQYAVCFHRHAKINLGWVFDGCCCPSTWCSRLRCSNQGCSILPINMTHARLTSIFLMSHCLDKATGSLQSLGVGSVDTGPFAKYYPARSSRSISDIDLSQISSLQVSRQSWHALASSSLLSCVSSRKWYRIALSWAAFAIDKTVSLWAQPDNEWRRSYRASNQHLLSDSSEASRDTRARSVLVNLPHLAAQCTHEEMLRWRFASQYFNFLKTRCTHVHFLGELP